MRTRILLLLGVALAMSAPTAVSGQAHWNQFRGTGGLGLAPDDKALPVELDVTRNLRWTREVPPGHSSPCIWGDRIFLTGATSFEVLTICIDRTTGEELWRQAAMTDMFERRHRVNSSATPTATADGERVYVYFGSCGLICYDFDGEEQWMRRMRIPENMYGTASSPIIVGDTLVFQSDNAKGSFLAAIDPATGETRWKTEREEFIASWSSPMHWRHDGVDEIVLYGAGWINAYALEDGSARWSMPGVTDEPCITPITAEGVIYLTSYNMKTNSEVIGLPEFADLVEQYDKDGDGELTFKEIRPNKSILSRADADGEGDHPLPGFFRYLDVDRNDRLTTEEWKKMIAFLDQFKYANAIMAIRPVGENQPETEILWQHNRGVPECPSPLHYDGRIYMVKNGGLISCLNAGTGELHYQERLESGGPYYASPVAGDGKVYATSARGVITVVEAGDTLKILAHNDLDERTMATPALVDGMVYVRTETRLMAFGRP